MLILSLQGFSHKLHLSCLMKGNQFHASFYFSLSLLSRTVSYLMLLLLVMASHPYRRRLLRHIWVCSTSTETTCGSYCKYAKRNLQFQKKSALSGMINRLNKANTLKPSVKKACIFVLAKPTQIVPSTQINLQGFTWQGFQAFPKLPHAGIEKSPS